MTQWHPDRDSVLSAVAEGAALLVVVEGDTPSICQKAETICTLSRGLRVLRWIPGKGAAAALDEQDGVLLVRVDDGEDVRLTPPTETSRARKRFEPKRAVPEEKK